MTKWKNREQEHPGLFNKWVVVWDGSDIGAALWVAPEHGQVGYFKDMVANCFYDNVTHWAELPMDPQNVIYEPVSKDPKKIIFDDICEALAAVTSKYPGLVLELDESSIKISNMDDKGDE